MTKVFWDAMIFIYWIEGHPTYSKRVAEILRKMETRGDRLYTSSLAVGEVLVGPRKVNAGSIVAQIEAYFLSSAIELVPLSYGAAVRYSRLRAQYKIEPADAVHLACAAEEGIDLFVTNDKDLLGVTVPGIKFIADLSTNLY